jgi:hypothetical protein
MTFFRLSYLDGAAMLPRDDRLFHLALATCIALLVAAIGCKKDSGSGSSGSSSALSDGGGDRAEDSRHNMHKLQIALLEYADKKNGEWPDRLDQIKEDVGGEAAMAKLMKNPLTGDDPGYEYVKPKGNLNDKRFDSQQVILYQLRGGKRDTSIKVGYADASVRMLGTK